MSKYVGCSQAIAGRPLIVETPLHQYQALSASVNRIDFSSMLSAIPSHQASRCANLQRPEVRMQEGVAEQQTSGNFLERVFENEIERYGQKQLAMRLRRATRWKQLTSPSTLA
jgi:hypothetical protein